MEIHDARRLMRARGSRSWIGTCGFEIANRVQVRRLLAVGASGV
jgi:hypothetical protein